MAAEEQSNGDSELAIGALTPVLEVLDGLNRMVNLRTSIVENLDSIDVPPELETSHEELVAAANEWIDLVERVFELLEAADPESTVGTGIINDPELDPDRGDDINHRAGLACREIELTAAANGVEADLGCFGYLQEVAVACPQRE